MGLERNELENEIDFFSFLVLSFLCDGGWSTIGTLEVGAMIFLNDREDETEVERPNTYTGFDFFFRFASNSFF